MVLADETLGFVFQDFSGVFRAPNGDFGRVWHETFVEHLSHDVQVCLNTFVDGHLQTTQHDGKKAA